METRMHSMRPMLPLVPVALFVGSGINGNSLQAGLQAALAVRELLSLLGVELMETASGKVI